MKLKFLIAVIFTLSIVACKNNPADLILYNAKVYTLDDSFSTATAFAIKDGRFIAVGSDSGIMAMYPNATEKLDAQQQIIYPGFIDAHAHFSGYALDLKSVKLFFTKSEIEMLQLVKTYAAKNNAPWIIGRGWDQNEWAVKEFPTNDSLNKWFPNTPVYLQRIDGHAALCNNKALELAGINVSTKINGGEIVVKNGKLTGVLIDNACAAIEKILPKKTESQAIQLFHQAQADCFAVGVTSAVDCGISKETLQWLQAAYKSGQLQFSQAIMLNDDSANYAAFLHAKPYTDDWMKIIGFKVYADGALGSRGAYLIEDYHDALHTKGLLLKSEDSIKAIAKLLINSPYQMCTHAIGDAGNRIVLNAYADVLKNKNDRRWRIEHAQVVNKNDIHLFGDFSIIPSVQPTHATSDMPWAANRLGIERMKDAYTYQQLLQQNKWMPLGTDFPVEYINPFYTFYSAVFRIYDTTKPAFQTADALTREQALRGMTTWAAKGSFEENTKGKIAVGMRADFIISKTDLMTADAQSCKNAQVEKTFVKGKCVWLRKTSRYP
jgi:predicted amidohydrolase YtcJ